MKTEVDKEAVLDCVNYLWDRLIKDASGQKKQADLVAECLSVTITLLSNSLEQMTGMGPEQSYEISRLTCIEFLSQKDTTVETHINPKGMKELQ